MKKLLVIPLMLLYITAVSGVMITMHYCGQELAAWNLYSDKAGCEDDACGDEQEENDPCCKDETIAAKVTTDQKLSQEQTFSPKDIHGDAVFTHPEYHISIQELAVNTLTNAANAPPDIWQGIPLYKLYSSYTYYG